MTIADLIRNMSDEDLAQMMLDIAYENTPIENGETYMRIPSPLGGYLAYGIVDLHDTDVIVDALQEEVELMTDREKYLTILDRFYRGRGGSLLTKDECEAMEYAIASIKTDFKYDLLYEGEDELCNGDCDNCDFVDGDYCRLNEKSIPVNLHVTEIKKHQSDFSDLVAIHTEGLDEEIRCTMCTNSMKSDRGCDGSCIVNDKMYKEVMDVIEDHIADADKMIEPTTKNNFVDGKDNNVTSTDCISRQEAIDTIRQLYIDLATQKYVIDLLKVLPSVTPQEPRWIPVGEKLPEPFTYVNATCRSLVDDRENWVVETLYLPIPKEVNKHGYSDWGNIPMLNLGDAEVIAWVERIIPQPYKAESEPHESEE